MQKHYLILGAGETGFEMAYDLLSRKTTRKVHVMDTNKELVTDLEKRLSSIGIADARLSTEKADARDVKYLRKKAEDASVIFSCLPYFCNLYVTEVAIEQGKIMCDLGGNNTIVDHQFEMDEEAAYNKARIFPACGIAPGAASIVAMDGITRMGGPDNVDSVHVYCGGLPTEPQGILNYKEVFSIEGLFNELREPCEVIYEFGLKYVAPMTGIERVELYEPFNCLQAAHTSGGLGRTINNFEGKIREMWYKTLRYNGHWEIMKSLFDLGYLSKEKQGCVASPAEISKELIGRDIRYESDDVILARWVINGIPKDGKQKIIQYDLINFGDQRNGRSAMQVMTSDSASAVGLIAESGKIPRYGVISQDEVPTKSFLKQWTRRRIWCQRRETNIKY
ncbi:saccharopine dehydrogenase family protein [Nanoarchaeota archaeon]